MIETRRATRYFWIEGGSPRSNREYHWLVDCPWLIVEVTGGATCVSGLEPPPNARETTFISVPASQLRPVSTLAAALYHRSPETSHSSDGGGRWLCDICYPFKPSAEPVVSAPSGAPCARCRCSKALHDISSVFDTGCGMGWLEVLPLDALPQDQQIGILHCRCTGYRALDA